MSWTDPNTYIAGAILSAVQMNAMQANLLAGGPTYTTEAARLAAIPAPFEGQRAYITASTMTVPTGAITAFPTGIQTIYNGAEWVCVTPIGASSNTAGTTTSAAYVTTLTGDATPLAVTTVTGTTAMILISGGADASAALNAYLSISVSGTTTLLAADTQGAFTSCTSGSQLQVVARTQIITGLTAGTNTFTLNYRTTAGTVTYRGRSMIVQGVA